MSEQSTPVNDITNLPKSNNLRSKLTKKNVKRIAIATLVVVGGAYIVSTERKRGYDKGVGDVVELHSDDQENAS